MLAVIICCHCETGKRNSLGDPEIKLKLEQGRL